ncbi:hypothetical protein Hanom_Chr11g01062211 [Helianthus anomalus]
MLSIQSLCNNGFKSIPFLKISFIYVPKSSSPDVIVIIEVLGRPFYDFKGHFGVVLVVNLSNMTHQIKYILISTK